MKNIKEFLKVNNIPYKYKFDLINHNTFKIKCVADFFVEPKNSKEVIRLINYLHEQKIKYFILGNGSNVIFVNKYYKGVVIYLNLKYIRFYEKQNSDEVVVSVGAGVSIAQLLHECALRGLTGLEWAVGVPASVGGAVVMNMGANGYSVCQTLKKVNILKKNGKKTRKNAKITDFDYRNSIFKKNGDIILSVTFVLKKSSLLQVKNKLDEYISIRRKKQPLSMPSAGSVFKNAEKAAGYLIDTAALKGTHIGGALVSEKHANFIVNAGGATGRDVLCLIKLIQHRVKKVHGVNLECEVCFVK